LRYTESKNPLFDEETQMISEHVAKVKEIFKGHEYLFLKSCYGILDELFIKLEVALMNI